MRSKSPGPTERDEMLRNGRRGMSAAEIAAELEVSTTTLRAWAQRSRVFADALDRALTASLAWWEERVRLAADAGSRFNIALWLELLAARFPDSSYGERHGLEKLAKVVAPADKLAAPGPGAVFDIPDNGRDRRSGD